MAARVLSPLPPYLGQSSPQRRALLNATHVRSPTLPAGVVSTNSATSLRDGEERGSSPSRLGENWHSPPSQLNTTQTAIDGLDLLAMADYACAETLGRVGRSELG